MANLISIFRIIVMFCAIFLIIFCSGQPEAYILAAIFTLLAFALDGVDGYVARKFNEESKIGALLDIMGDRIVENCYWILFAVAGWLPIIFPLIAITRGFVTDTIRSAAMEKGYTAFGESTMQRSNIAKFICGSKFMRISYAAIKVFAFVMIIVAKIPDISNAEVLTQIGFWSAVVAITFCVIRGLPVIFEAGFLFKEDKNQNGEV